MYFFLCNQLPNTVIFVVSSFRGNFSCVQTITVLMGTDTGRCFFLFLLLCCLCDNTHNIYSNIYLFVFFCSYKTVSFSFCMPLIPLCSEIQFLNHVKVFFVLQVRVRSINASNTQPCSQEPHTAYKKKEVLLQKKKSLFTN